MRFVIRRSKDGQFWFRINASNGEAIAHSVLFTAKESAQRTVETIRMEAAAGTVVDMTGERLGAIGRAGRSGERGAAFCERLRHANCCGPSTTVVTAAGERTSSQLVVDAFQELASRIVGALCLGGLLAACATNGVETQSSSPSSTTPMATASPSASEAEGTIAVSLSEMDLIVSASSAPAGEVTFEIRNVGGLPHELVVISTDQDAAELPVEDVKVVEEGLDVIARSDHVAAGEEATLAVSLEPGHYVLICNLSGHYEQSQFGPGMRENFDVQ